MIMNIEVTKLDFTQKLIAAFETNSQSKIFQKGDFLLKEGEIEKNLFLIEEGAVKVYYLAEFGEKIVRLGYSESIINSLSSFLNNSPSELYIEAIRETKVKILAQDIVQNIRNNSLDYSNFLEIILIQQIDREVDLLLDSPTRRLERVLKRSPNLFQHVPLKYIASYLRMSPETLSRIRKC